MERILREGHVKGDVIRVRSAGNRVKGTVDMGETGHIEVLSSDQAKWQYDEDVAKRRSRQGNARQQGRGRRGGS